MEDAHVTVLNLDESPTDKNTFFAVYDGHGGNSLFFLWIVSFKF
jgi:protein phosphatase 2C family protein 2/3